MNVPWEVLVGGGVAVIALFVWLVVNKKIFLKTNFFEIHSDDKQNLYKVISKAIIVSNAIRDIESIERLNAQMEYCEIGIANNQSICMERFVNILCERGVKDPMSSKEYKIYGQNIKLMLVTMRCLVREVYEKMVKMFDYDSVDDVRIVTDFSRFRDTSAQTLLRTATQKITDEWVPLDIITRDECYQLNLSIVPKLVKEISDAIQRGLEVQIGYKQRLNALYKELEDYIANGGQDA